MAERKTGESEQAKAKKVKKDKVKAKFKELKTKKDVDELEQGGIGVMLLTIIDLLEQLIKK